MAVPEHQIEAVNQFHKNTRRERKFLYSTAGFVVLALLSWLVAATLILNNGTQQLRIIRRDDAIIRQVTGDQAVRQQQQQSGKVVDHILLCTKAYVDHKPDPSCP